MSNRAYTQKLSIIDDYLLVSGWTRCDRHAGAWAAPLHIRYALRFQHPAPEELCFARRHAVGFQVLADELAESATDCGRAARRADWQDYLDWASDEGRAVEYVDERHFNESV